MVPRLEIIEEGEAAACGVVLGEERRAKCLVVVFMVVLEHRRQVPHVPPHLWCSAGVPSLCTDDTGTGRGAGVPLGTT